MPRMLASEGNLEPDFLRMQGQSELEGKCAKFTHYLTGSPLKARKRRERIER